ncbi:MAG: iron-containing alcohol dehydrogenase [Acidimicrobiia bacterium]|nr:iron-containing alcohol dehydrogenase [Acidimicrobiia bacterium]
MIDLPLFPMIEESHIEVLDGLGAYTACVNDPPWSDIAQRVSPPQRVIQSWNMDVAHLETLIEGEGDSEIVVGVGGGSALDTAKYVAWKTGKRLMQIPTITSVDAGFTDAVGVRVDGNVKYIGDLVPEMVVLDVDLVRSAPPRLNRGGIGDILSCLTGLTDWRLAADRGEGVPWDDELALLGETLLHELDVVADEIGAVSGDAIRWMASAYRRIGAGCRLAGHSRFEEGSEHFLGYSYEYHTGDHQVHGELISMCVVAMATLQGHGADRATSIITRAKARANPADLGIVHEAFTRSIVDLPTYVRREGLDYSIIDMTTVDESVADRLWTAVSALPKEQP